MSGPVRMVRARAPGRVNLIGDHTDYTGGYVLPMALELATTVVMAPGGRVVELRSDTEEEIAAVPLGLAPERAPTWSPSWARFVAAVVAVLDPPIGGRGTVSTTLPVGAGLSSSSALTVALALALGFSGPPLELARLCQRAEQLGSGVPGGIMDQLCAAAARAGHALLIDCRSLETTPVRIPDGCEVLIAHSGEARKLSESGYARRSQECQQAEAVLGPLRDASTSDLDGVADPILRRRARHVVTENQRVLDTASCLAKGDLASAGTLMSESHASLRDDFEVSTPALDAVVAALQAAPGVLGARLTGAGFGGCVVALAEKGASPPVEVWRVSAAGAATVEELHR